MLTGSTSPSTLSDASSWPGSGERTILRTYITYSYVYVERMHVHYRTRTCCTQMMSGVIVCEATIAIAIAIYIVRRVICA